MNWVLIFAGVCAAIGLVMGTIGLKTMRSQIPAGAELSWQQMPLSTWRYETPTMIAITIHSLGLFLLSAFVLLSLSRSSLFPIQWDLSLLLSILAVYAIFYTVYVTGVTIAYHFTQGWIRPVTYGISNAGMLYGSTLIPWKSYSHYELGPQAGQISLYSSYSPSLRSWVLQPPAESRAGIFGLIQNNLPSGPAPESSNPWRSPWVLILGMAALVVGALLPATWGWTRVQSWVWIYAFLAFFFLNRFGIQLLTRFDGREPSEELQLEEQ